MASGNLERLGIQMLCDRLNYNVFLLEMVGVPPLIRGL